MPVHFDDQLTDLFAVCLFHQASNRMAAVMVYLTREQVDGLLSSEPFQAEVVEEIRERCRDEPEMQEFLGDGVRFEFLPPQWGTNIVGDDGPEQEEEPVSPKEIFDLRYVHVPADVAPIVRH